MSNIARRIKAWYERGVWTEAMVIDAHERGAITAGELREILGMDPENGDDEEVG